MDGEIPRSVLEDRLRASFEAWAVAEGGHKPEALSRSPGRDCAYCPEAERDWQIWLSAGLTASSPLIAQQLQIVEVIQAVCDALDAPMNRFGKLEPNTLQGEKARQLRVRYQSAPSTTSIDGAVNLFRAALPKILKD